MRRESIFGVGMWPTLVVFSPDGSQLASASEWAFRVWNTKTGQKVGTLQGHISWVSVIAFLLDGWPLASVSNDPTVRLWDTKTEQEIQKLEDDTRQTT